MPYKRIEITVSTPTSSDKKPTPTSSANQVHHREKDRARRHISLQQEQGGQAGIGVEKHIYDPSSRSLWRSVLCVRCYQYCYL